jgi:phosphoserine phosphatase RsbU/P
MRVSRMLRLRFVLYVVLALLFAVSAAYRVLDISERFDLLWHGSERARDPFDPDLPEYRLEGVEEESAAAGLQRGDVLVTIDHQPVHYSPTDLWRPLRRLRPGDRLAVEVRRPGTPGPINAALVLRPLRTGPPRAVEVLAFSLLNVLFPLICTALGFWVAAVRVQDTRAWLLLFLCLSVAEFAGGEFHFLYGRNDVFQPVAAAYQPILANFWPTALLLFTIYFPERLAIDRRYPWVKWLVLLPVAIRVVGLNPVFEYVTHRNPERGLALYQALGWTGPYVLVSFPLFVVLAMAVMAYRTVTEHQPDARRRLLLLDVGLLVSLLPGLLWLVLLAAGVRDFPDWFIYPILGFLFLFPLTMAYVIVVQRAMDVRLVVRQGVQYVLARGSIRILQLVGSVLIFYVTVERLNAPRVMSRYGVFQYAPIAVGVVGLLAIGRFAERVQRWVDRRFFREAYDTERLLAELAMQVRTIVETQPLVETVARQISSVLHIPRLAILLNSTGYLRPVFALGYTTVETIPAPVDSEGIASDQALRDALDAELVLPLAANTKLVGVMGLGPKRSEEPFTSSDVRLLEAVATQTGFALENSRLTAEIATEVAEREKRKREMEIAREVQQRLFPQVLPIVPGLDVAGACRPALAVGGDYYDFVQLQDGSLGIAIGDISGKGIPASLLMATLRAYLRSQTIQTHHDLPAMIANLNSLVFESSDSNRYATFFYGRYNPASRVLDYVNAGHNPPMVFRSNPGEIIRLDIGGPVIGLLPEWTYEQGSVTLQPEDLLVSFTDGISEAMNIEMEEWGEDRLIATVQSADSLSLDALIARIMAGADGHTGTAPQHDDMTLVVARCR